MSYQPADRGRHEWPDAAPGSPDSQSAGIWALPAQNPNIQHDRYADDLFWIMFDDGSRRLLCNQDLAGLALAAAMLIELAAGGWVTVRHGMLRIERYSVPPRDVPTHALLEQITAEPEALEVRDWLEYLSGHAVNQVVQRLVRARTMIRREHPRRFRQPAVTYVPASNNAAAWPRSRLSTFVRQGHRLSNFDMVLTSLCDAAGLLHMVLEGVPEADRAALINNIDAHLAGHNQPVLAIIGDLRDTVTTSTAALA